MVPLAQVVRALTVMLHRQWLTLRRAGAVPRTTPQRRTVRCLRDTVLLLHSLSQKDKLFTMHCVEVLHQYDQVMPGVSTLIRGLPDVTDCEGEQILCLLSPHHGLFQPGGHFHSLLALVLGIWGWSLLISVELAQQSHGFSRTVHVRIASVSCAACSS